MVGFWQGGAAAYEDGLRKHYLTLLVELREKRDASQEARERSALADEFERTRAEYDQKLRELRRLVF